MAAGLNRGSALAEAVLGVKVVVASSHGWAIGNYALAVAGILVPVEPFCAVNRRTLASAAVGVPEEVVRALLRAAYACTDGFIENLVFRALNGFALTLARLSVHILVSLAVCRHLEVIAFAFASVGVPEKFIRTVVGRFWLLAEASTNIRVKVVRLRAAVRLAKAGTSQ